MALGKESPEEQGGPHGPTRHGHQPTQVWRVCECRDWKEHRVCREVGAGGKERKGKWEAGLSLGEVHELHGLGTIRVLRTPHIRRPDHGLGAEPCTQLAA